MPFKSQAQRKFMFARHPTIAKRWAKKYGVPKDLPQKIGAKKKKPSMAGYIMHRRKRRIRYKTLRR